MLALAMFAPCIRASASQLAPYQQGTVLSVDRQEVSSPSECCYIGTDGPLQSQYYAYDVSVRIGCENYVGRYETAFDFLSSAFTPNKSISVRLTKHILYFDVPGEREIKMGIVHRSHNDTASCSAGTSTARR
jgi:hypothetical protein